MTEMLWKLPVPATRVMRPRLVQLPKRMCELSFDVEGEEDAIERVALGFEGVEAYRCTYMTSITSDMTRAAYGELVRLEITQWLTEVLKAYSSYCAYAKQAPRELQHVMICFDDGPCYEVICTDVKLPS